MKRSLFIYLFISVFFFISCGDDSGTSANSSASLDGNWTVIEANGTEVFGGRLEITEREFTWYLPNCKMEGSFSTSGNKMTMTYSWVSGDGCVFEEGESAETNWEVSGDELVFEDSEGSVVFRGDLDFSKGVNSATDSLIHSYLIPRDSMWFIFDVQEGETYRLQWEALELTGGALIYVSAYQADGNTAYFEEAEEDYSSTARTIEAEDDEIKVLVTGYSTLQQGFFNLRLLSLASSGSSSAVSSGSLSSSALSSSALSSSSSEAIQDGTIDNPWLMSPDGSPVTHHFRTSTPGHFILTVPSAGVYYLNSSQSLMLAGVEAWETWEAKSHLSRTDGVFTINASEAGDIQVRLYLATTTTGLDYESTITFTDTDPALSSSSGTSSSAASAPQIPDWLLGKWDYCCNYTDSLRVWDDSIVQSESEILLDPQYFEKDSLVETADSTLYFVWTNDPNVTEDYYEFRTFAANPDSLFLRMVTIPYAFTYKYLRAETASSSSGTSSSTTSSSSITSTVDLNNPTSISGGATAGEAVTVSPDIFYEVASSDIQFFSMNVTAGETFYVYLIDNYTTDTSPLPDNNYSGDVYMTITDADGSTILIDNADFYTTSYVEEMTTNTSGVLSVEIREGYGSGDWAFVISSELL